MDASCLKPFGMQRQAKEYEEKLAIVPSWGHIAPVVRLTWTSFLSLFTSLFKLLTL